MASVIDHRSLCTALGATPTPLNVTLMTFATGRKLILEELQALQDPDALNQILSAANLLSVVSR